MLIKQALLMGSGFAMLARLRKIKSLEKHLNFITKAAKSNAGPLHGSGANTALEILKMEGFYDYCYRY
jgi:hypothetical protein